MRSLHRGFDGWFSRFKKAGGEEGGGGNRGHFNAHCPDPSGKMGVRGSDSKPTVIALIEA